MFSTQTWGLIPWWVTNCLFSIFTILFNTFKISPATVAASIDVFLPSLTIQPSKGRENEPWLAFTPE